MQVVGKRILNTKINTNIPNYMQKYIEMRSDVKTLPTPEMRNSVSDAIFGDDAFTEDPTTNKLYDFVCKLFNKKYALFVPTGTLGNLVCLSLSVPHGNYVLQGARCHLNKTELAGQKRFGFIPLLTETLDEIDENFDFEKMDKILDNPEVLNKIKVIAFENTHNYSGGKIVDTNFIDNKVIPYLNKKFPDGIHYHLDGSRVLNAAAVLNVEPSELVKPYRTIVLCLSKAIGAPCGSVILFENEEDYKNAINVRQSIGGAMRQNGFLAAPALVGLETWRERLLNDHKNAVLLAEGLNQVPCFRVEKPHSNIVNAYPVESYLEKEDLPGIERRLEEEYNLRLHSMDGNSYLRMVLHHQVSKEQVDETITIFKKEFIHCMCEARAM